MTTTTTDRDKPVISATLASLDVEAAPAAFVYGTKSGKRITFPDPGEMDWEQAEQFMLDISGNGGPVSNAEALEKWIGKAGLDALREDHLTLRQFMALMAKVQGHYASAFGTPGESVASES